MPSRPPPPGRSRPAPTNTVRLTQRYCSSPVLSRQVVPDALRLLDPAQTEGPIANDEASYFLQTRTGDGHPSPGDSSGSVGAVKYVALGLPSGLTRLAM